MATGLLFTACNPMDDINAEIDSQENIISGETTFAMSDDDYDVLELSYGNFSNVDDAKTMIPKLLSSKFPVWGAGSLATVTFDLYSPKRTEKSLEVYTVASSDYADLGFTYGNFSSFDQIVTFLDWKYPSPANRVLVSLTYKYYSGSVNTVKNGFIYVDGEWNFLQGFTRSEYNVMGENYDNFTSSTVAEARIPIYLKEYFKFDSKKAGDIAGIMYNIYKTDSDDIDGDGRTDDKAAYSYVFYCIYDGSDWTEYKNIIQETIKFGHDGTTWVPDNTIKYTFISDDVALISNALMGAYPGPADNVGYFGSFDRRTSSSNYWSDDMLLEAFNILLDNKNPSAEEGQKYVLTFIIYNGTTTNETKSVIKTNGVWVYQ